MGERTELDRRQGADVDTGMDTADGITDAETGTDAENAAEGSFAADQTLPVIEWVAEQMPGGFLIYQDDEDQRLVYANTAILRMYGCGSLDEFRELTGFTFRGMVHPEDYPAVHRFLEKCRSGETDNWQEAVEYRIVRKDGTVRWVDDFGHFSGFPGFGGVFYVFLLDVTEKHMAQDESGRRAEVIEGLSVDFSAICLINLESGSMRPYRMDDFLLSKITGEHPEKQDWRTVLSAYAEQCVVERDRKAFLDAVSGEHIRRRLEEGGSVALNYGVFSPDGEDRYMQLSVVRGGGPADQRHHAVMGFRDVTEQTRRVQEDAASRLRMELELEKEKQTHEAKSAFLFNISHDIRTPMNAIVGFTNLAREHIDQRDLVVTYLDRVRESNAHMVSLIDDLLEMSQIDSGQVHLNPQVCSLRKELQESMDVMSAQAESKGVALTAELDIPETEVLVDAHRFRRIMTNLISNGVKFTPVGGSVTVTAHAGPVSESGYARYEFRVADTGVGMSEEFLRRIFKAFEREESSTRSGAMGTGLGLSIVKVLLNAMGGSIAVESRKGEGSAFTVSLPVKLAGEGSRAVETAPAPVPKSEGEHRILLVEDIEINRLLAETVLEDAGFLVESVPDGTDAVEVITNRPLWYFDLVLMDIQMPVMNGYEATRAIRAMDREDAKEIPIIALSANARDEDRRISMESGMNNHIAKPFDVAGLITTINECISTRKGAKAEAVHE